MSLVKHGLQLSLQLTVPEVRNCKPIMNSTQEVADLLHLEKLCVLGHGNYGTAYKVRHRKTSAIYALKIIRGGEPSHEIQIMHATDSPFIIE